MHDIKIGTLVNADNATKILPKLIPYGFETFSLVFSEKIGSIDLKRLAESINKILKDTNCSISSVSIFGNTLSDTENGLAVRQGFYDLASNAHLFGTDIVTGFAGRITNKSVPESIGKFKEVFTPITEAAKEKGVKIAFENCCMGGNWNSGDWNIAFCEDAWEMMFEAIPYENIGLQWEPCHQMVQLTDPIPQLRKWTKKIFSVHGKDATIAWNIINSKGISGREQFVWHRTPGFGDSNWTNIISILRMNGYKGSIDIEGGHDPVYKDELEYTGQVHALNYLKNCRGGELVPNFDIQ